MKKEHSYKDQQDKIFERLVDRANEEAEGILRKAHTKPLTDEDYQKLSATDVAGHTWLQDEFEKEKKQGK